MRKSLQRRHLCCQCKARASGIISLQRYANMHLAHMNSTRPAPVINTVRVMPGYSSCLGQLYSAEVLAVSRMLVFAAACEHKWSRVACRDEMLQSCKLSTLDVTLDWRRSWIRSPALAQLMTVFKQPTFQNSRHWCCQRIGRATVALLGMYMHHHDSDRLSDDFSVCCQAP